ncbi:hypothetical protein M8542_43990 [Amycolatopsis sp. OK19-0408]|uniref:Uncharacterized protein n=1 Tax=Amycolatopsis iheyensis TaxID=2945988 RepID=A0A9X2NJ86_9PSEU|nr:hypothetical protein [Amycolatopsis iheyensis]MCR6489796.1 hypothetical protein [Amycolatopsis iheyensis]
MLLELAPDPQVRTGLPGYAADRGLHVRAAGGPAGTSLLTSGVPPTALLPVIQHGSYLFGIEGSVLAVGALAALALLLVIYRDGSSSPSGDETDREVTRGAAVTLTAGALTAGAFLLFGYDDIYRVFNSTGHFSALFWTLHLVGLFAPIVWAVVRTHHDIGSRRKWRPVSLPKLVMKYPAQFAVSWLFLVPTVSFLLASHFVYPSSRLSAGISTTVCAVWSGLSMGGLLMYERKA